MPAIMLSRHDHEIVRDEVVHVYLDHRHIGSGGDDSWSPSVHQVRWLLWPSSLLCHLLLPGSLV